MGKTCSVLYIQNSFNYVHADWKKVNMSPAGGFKNHKEASKESNASFRKIANGKVQKGFLGICSRNKFKLLDMKEPSIFYRL